jgi:hypothetical protein
MAVYYKPDMNMNTWLQTVAQEPKPCRQTDISEEWLLAAACYCDLCDGRWNTNSSHMVDTSFICGI